MLQMGWKRFYPLKGWRSLSSRTALGSREKTRVCFNYGCSTGSRAKCWLNTPAIQWEEETGEIGLQIQHTTFIRFTQGLQRSRIHPSGEQTQLPCQGKRNYTFIKTKGRENSVKPTKTSQSPARNSEDGLLFKSTLTPQLFRCVSFTCFDAEVLL